MNFTVLDDLLTPEENLFVHEECLKIPCLWAAADKSMRERFPMSKYWHFWNGKIFWSRRDGEDNSFLYEKHPSIMKVWDKVKEKIFVGKKYAFFVCDLNVQTIGNEGPLHNDNGDLSILYYTNPNWKIHWDGGTAFYNEKKEDCINIVSYKAGRAVIYDASIPHKAISISKHADEVRTVLVFKCKEVKL